MADETTNCLVIDPTLVDGCGVTLAKELMVSNPQLNCVFIASNPLDQRDHQLNEEFNALQVECVNKTSGLASLRIAVARAVRPRA